MRSARSLLCCLRNRVYAVRRLLAVTFWCFCRILPVFVRLGLGRALLPPAGELFSAVEAAAEYVEAPDSVTSGDSTKGGIDSCSVFMAR